MKNLEHTTDLEEFLINDLKSDEDIKLFLNASLKDYLEDGDFNSFYRALEIVIKAKDTVSGFAKKLDYLVAIYIAYLKTKKNLNFQQLLKFFKNLAMNLKWHKLHFNFY